ncbi:MAG: HD domain-containing protein [Magnetococcales bacterium]|nr:HD domain-containing protein [Magnetococcales bacterium]
MRLIEWCRTCNQRLGEPFPVKSGGVLVLFLFLLCGVGLGLQAGVEMLIGIAVAGMALHQISSVPRRTWLTLFLFSLWRKPPKPDELIETLINYSYIARKDGILELERHAAVFLLLQSAKNLCVDGATPSFLARTIKQESRTVIQQIRSLRTTTGLILASVALWLVIGLLLASDTAVAIRSDTPWLVLLFLFGLWNHWRLGVLADRLKTAYTLISTGIQGIMVGVNPRMLQELLRAGQNFLWSTTDLSQEEPPNGEPSPSTEEVLADLDRYLEKFPPLVLTDPPTLPMEDATGKQDPFRFADLFYIDNCSTQTLLREISNDLLLTALRGATPRTARHLLSNIGPRAGKMLVEDLEWMGPVEERAIRNAHQEILKILLRLEGDGSVVILSRGLATFPGWESWEACRGYLIKTLPQKHVDVLERAFRFAEQWHGDQKRPSGEPYTLHLLQVLEVLLTNEYVRDVDLLVVGLLHDVVEDTECTLDEICSHFGERVAELVDWLTKPERVEGESKEAGKKRYLERLRQAPREAILLKLADRLSNVQFLETHPRPEFQRKYYRETLEYVLPLTDGFPRFHWWFQDWQETAGWRWTGEEQA